MPAKARLQIDYKKLADCLSVVDEAGKTQHAKYWELHPGSQEASADLGCTRKQAAQLWDEHKAKMSKYIPHVVHLQRRQVKGK